MFWRPNVCEYLKRETQQKFSGSREILKSSVFIPLRSRLPFSKKLHVFCIGVINVIAPETLRCNLVHSSKQPFIEMSFAFGTRESSYKIICIVIGQQTFFSRKEAAVSTHNCSSKEEPFWMYFTKFNFCLRIN